MLDAVVRVRDAARSLEDPCALQLDLLGGEAREQTARLAGRGLSYKNAFIQSLEPLEPLPRCPELTRRECPLARCLLLRVDGRFETLLGSGDLCPERPLLLLTLLFCRFPCPSLALACVPWRRQRRMAAATAAIRTRQSGSTSLSARGDQHASPHEGATEQLRIASDTMMRKEDCRLRECALA